MNEFIEQFLLEARELVEQAVDDLLALEKGVGGKEKLDALFRAFHTLKGAAGIVDFAPMGRALHAVESTLSDVRNKARPVSPALVSDCLACLDQVTRWLDEMEAKGAPPADADGAADAIVEKFAGRASEAPDRQRSSGNDRRWLENLRSIHGLPATGVAVRYRPDAEAFFRGEDPLAQVARIPGLVVLDLALRGGITLETIEPFACVVEIIGAATAPIEQVRTLFEDCSETLEIIDLSDGLVELPAEARSILEAQVRLLRELDADGKIGRLAAAGRVAENVMRYAGRADKASSFGIVLNECLIDGNASKLIAAITRALGGAAVSAPGDDEEKPFITQAAVTRVLRVDIGRVDALVNLTGELTVVKNAFGHMATLAHAGLDPKNLAAGLREQQGRFDRLVGELQRAVLRIRVLPLRQVFHRFPRLVREISASLGKSVAFTTDGDSTEADAAIVEGLFEPLLHIVRNAIDHGGEHASRRKQLGKPSTSMIVLRARRHLENVIVEVEDDGPGIDLGRVRKVAADRKILPPETLANMSDTEVVGLIFAPGFSTVSEVTGLSGRGVGMDSVKAGVERLGGTVGVDSRRNQGTIVRLTLPFTVMMSRVMTVETAGQVFGFPLDTVVETAIVARHDVSAIGRGRAFILRDRTVPLIDLAENLGLPRSDQAKGEVKVVVTSSGGRLGGIEVEKLGERMDIMLKPMDGLLKNMRGVAGTTLLGDGRVLVVLDVQELFE